MGNSFLVAIIEMSCAPLPPPPSRAVFSRPCLDLLPNPLLGESPSPEKLGVQTAPRQSEGEL